MVTYVGRNSQGVIDVADPKNGFTYFIGIGNYGGQDIGDAKSLQEIIKELQGEIALLKQVITKKEIEEIVEEREEGGEQGWSL